MNREEYEEYETSLPITLALNHKLLGMDETTMCEACKRGDHANCNLATWCMCDDDCDGIPEEELDYNYYDLP